MVIGDFGHCDSHVRDVVVGSFRFRVAICSSGSCNVNIFAKQMQFHCHHCDDDV